ncbi:hypothetical protein BO86DRAFT_26839 [Aspergillus japonicus CBS 114.51]|uniref:Uncharacterized protein n=1 Tax=Aspergillus japonicus CBS 114.51 TaxID=1448312 RepID=A0A8T8WK58_ASPJA|nr:hypothetical protein BO86DRAFT_26839 [Aspergillus japonicus CBS 114.51]RAH76241.1 hypothetical protein BO86DRAFT_26839 [Aspergillus japonicus CBS 114.51]
MIFIHIHRRKSVLAFSMLVLFFFVSFGVGSPMLRWRGDLAASLYRHPSKLHSTCCTPKLTNDYCPSSLLRTDTQASCFNLKK